MPSSYSLQSGCSKIVNPYKGMWPVASIGQPNSHFCVGTWGLFSFNSTLLLAFSRPLAFFFLVLHFLFSPSFFFRDLSTLETFWQIKQDESIHSLYTVTFANKNFVIFLFTNSWFENFDEFSERPSHSWFQNYISSKGLGYITQRVLHAFTAEQNSRWSLYSHIIFF